MNLSQNQITFAVTENGGATMPKPTNAFLAKQAEKQKQRDMIVMSWSHQMCYDALTLVLNDPPFFKVFVVVCKPATDRDTANYEQISNIYDACAVSTTLVVPFVMLTPLTKSIIFGATLCSVNQLFHGQPS